MFENIQKQLDIIIKNLDLDEVVFDISLYQKISSMGLNIKEVEVMLTDIINNSSPEEMEVMIFQEPEEEIFVTVYNESELYDEDSGYHIIKK